MTVASVGLWLLKFSPIHEELIRTVIQVALEVPTVLLETILYISMNPFSLDLLL